MSTVVKRKQYAKASEGIHPGRLVKFKNLGLVEYMGEKRPRGNFDWIILDESDELGAPIHVYESFNLTIENKSRLGKILTEMLGMPPDDEIVLEGLVGTECGLEIRHNANDGKIYANIEKHLPHAPREKTKAAGARTVVARSQPQEDLITDADIPF
jgi:hypothetical protein